MFAAQSQNSQPIKTQHSSGNPITKVIDKVIKKVTGSDFIHSNEKQNPVKLMNSEPIPKPAQKAQMFKEQHGKKHNHMPRFIRSSSKSKPNVVIKFLSPSTKKNPLVHQPVQPKKEEEEKPFRREVIPPSDLVHDKFKNFDQNPEKFFVDVDEGLDKVFKQSVESIIRNAKVIPVKDWEIRDSTDLLDGFVPQQ